MATCNLQPLLSSLRSPVFRWKTIFVLVTTLSANLVSSSSSFSSSDISPSRLCHTAIDPDACQTILKQTVSSYGGGSAIRTPAGLLEKFLVEYLPSMEAAAMEFGMVRGEFNQPRKKRAITDCVELMELSVNEVRDTIKAIASKTIKSRHHADAQTSLSAVITNHLTCMESLDPLEKSPVKGVLDGVISRSIIALAVLAEIIGQTEEDNGVRLPFNGKIPSWVKSRDKKLLKLPWPWPAAEQGKAGLQERERENEIKNWRRKIR